MSLMARCTRSVTGCAVYPAVKSTLGYPAYNGNSVPMPLAFAR